MDRIAKVAITDLQKGVRRFVYEHDAHSDPFCDLINIALKTNKSKTYDLDGMKFMFVPHNPTVRVICLDSNEVTDSLKLFCDIIGYEMECIPVYDISKTQIDRYTAVCCFAHVPQYDDAMLEAALKTNCFYVGAIRSDSVPFAS